jgi:hypothetical protein
MTEPAPKIIPASKMSVISPLAVTGDLGGLMIVFQKRDQSDT